MLIVASQYPVLTLFTSISRAFGKAGALSRPGVLYVPRYLSEWPFFYKVLPRLYACRNDIFSLSYLLGSFFCLALVRLGIKHEGM